MSNLRSKKARPRKSCRWLAATVRVRIACVPKGTRRRLLQDFSVTAFLLLVGKLRFKMIISCKQEVCYRDYGDFVSLYNLKTGSVYVFEDVALDIFRAIASCPEGISLTDIETAISNEYECSPEVVSSDIFDFICELHKEKIITISGFDEIRIVSHENDATSDSTPSETDGIETEIIDRLVSRDNIYSVTFEMTYNCNEKCVHCYAFSDRIEQRLSYSEYCAIIDDLYDMNCQRISFTGGDPFVNPDFIDVFKYARKKGFICDIYTNGQYLHDNQERFDEIIKLFPGTIYISLYGPSAAIHDKITRIAGSFDKTLAVIRKLKQAGIFVVINIMALNINGDFIPATIDMLKSYGIEYRVGFSIINQNDGSSEPMKYFLDDKGKVKKIMRLTHTTDVFNDISLEDRMCGAAQTSLSVSPTGDVYPCISIKQKLGNIRQTKIKNIWLSEKRKGFIDSIRWKNTKKCKDCEKINFCTHCIGISEAESGDMFSCNFSDDFVSGCIYEIANEK